MEGQQGATDLPQSKADELYSVGYQAWGKVYFRRIEAVTSAVLPHLAGLSAAELLELEEEFQKLLAGGVRSAMYWGSMACGGPNSALDVPNGILAAIRQTRGAASA